MPSAAEKRWAALLWFEDPGRLHLDGRWKVAGSFPARAAVVEKLESQDSPGRFVVRKRTTNAVKEVLILSKFLAFRSMKT